MLSPILSRIGVPAICLVVGISAGWLAHSWMTKSRTVSQVIEQHDTMVKAANQEQVKNQEVANKTQSQIIANETKTKEVQFEISKQPSVSVCVISPDSVHTLNAEVDRINKITAPL